jgi:hypothetical protein
VTRRIITVSAQGAGGPSPDDYPARIVKYVPADVIAAWLAVASLLSAEGRGHRPVLWAVFAMLLIVTPLWTLRTTREQGKPPAWAQAGVSTAAFAVWVFATGVPFTWLAFYDTAFGGTALILFTLLSGLIIPAKADNPTP